MEGWNHIDIFMFLLKCVFIVSVSQDPFSSFAAIVNIFKTTIVSYFVINALFRFLIISLKCLNT